MNLPFEILLYIADLVVKKDEDNEDTAFRFSLTCRALRKHIAPQIQSDAKRRGDLKNLCIVLRDCYDVLCGWSVFCVDGPGERKRRQCRMYQVQNQLRLFLRRFYGLNRKITISIGTNYRSEYHELCLSNWLPAITKQERPLKKMRLFARDLDHVVQSMQRFTVLLHYYPNEMDRMDELFIESGARDLISQSLCIIRSNTRWTAGWGCKELRISHTRD